MMNFKEHTSYPEPLLKGVVIVVRDFAPGYTSGFLSVGHSLHECNQCIKSTREDTRDNPAFALIE